MKANDWYEQKWTPIHVRWVEHWVDPEDPNPPADPNEWVKKHLVEDGECEECGVGVGQCWWIKSDDTDACDWTNYWQMDEDAEHLLCEECYSDRTKEVG